MNFFQFSENKWLLLFVVLMVVNTFFSVYPGRSLEFLINYSETLVLYVAVIFFLNSETHFNKLTMVMVLSSLTLCLPLVLGKTPVGRTSMGTFYDPNDLSMFLITCLPFMFYHFHHGRKVSRFIALSSILFGIISVILTQSRMGFLALIVFALLYLGFGIQKKRQIILKTVLIGILGMFFVLMSSPLYFERMKTIFEENQTGSGRTIIWHRAMEMVSENPIFGVGPQAFSSAYGRILKAGKFESVVGYDHQWKTAHNSYILVMVELGIPGFIIYLILVTATLGNLLRMRKRFQYTKDGFDITSMANVVLMSLIIFLFCAYFLSQAYSVVFLLLISSGILLRKIAMQEVKGTLSKGEANH